MGGGAGIRGAACVAICVVFATASVGAGDGDASHRVEALRTSLSRADYGQCLREIESLRIEVESLQAMALQRRLPPAPNGWLTEGPKVARVRTGLDSTTTQVSQVYRRGAAVVSAVIWVNPASADSTARKVADAIKAAQGKPEDPRDVAVKTNLSRVSANSASANSVVELTGSGLTLAEMLAAFGQALEVTPQR